MKLLFFLTCFVLGFSLSAREYEEGKILIKFKSNIKSTKDLLPSQLKFQSELNLTQGKIQIFKIDLSDKTDSLAKEKAFFKLIEKLKQHPSVELAGPNFYYWPLNEPPLDKYFKLQWGLKNSGTTTVRDNVFGIKGVDINISPAWEITRGDKNIRVAVIDTGIDYNHPDLKNQVWKNPKEENGIPGVDDDRNGFIDDIYGFDFANNDNNPFDDHGHGTHVAGTIGAAHNEEGVRGVMGNVSLMSIKYLPNNRAGTTENAIKCFDYALKMKANIINTSWGGGNFDSLLLDAIKTANHAGVIVVAAAGNKGENNDIKPHYPSDYDSPNIISVAATDALDGLTFQSNYGQEQVDLAAPGKNIYSTLPGNRYGDMNGTSASAALVTGALGLLLSKEKNLPIDQIKNRLIATSVPLDSLRQKIRKGSGRLDVYNLLRNIRPPRYNDLDLVWEIIPVEPFESAHPYQNRTNISRTFKVPGAKYIRIVVEEFEMEKNDDFLELVSKNGLVVDRISGKGQNHISNYTNGDEIKVNFIGDFINTGWGFLIKEIQIAR